MFPRIVVVEDEEDIRQLLRDILEINGYGVVALARPSQASAAMGAQPPDLVLIDLMLPDMSGVELAASLRAQGLSSTPMIAMSASNLLLDMAADSGLFQEAIPKPFDMATILGCVRRHVSRSNR